MLEWPPEPAWVQYLSDAVPVEGYLTGGWIRCERGSLLIIQVEWNGAVAAAGTLGLQARESSALAVLTLPVLTAGIYGDWPNVVDGDPGSAAVIIKNPFREMRLTFDGAGEGTGSLLFNAWRELRAQAG